MMRIPAMKNMRQSAMTITAAKTPTITRIIDPISAKAPLMSRPLVSRVSIEI
jgi:hypothetical protein